MIITYIDWVLLLTYDNIIGCCYDNCCYGDICAVALVTKCFWYSNVVMVIVTIVIIAMVT